MIFENGVLQNPPLKAKEWIGETVRKFYRSSKEKTLAKEHKCKKGGKRETHDQEDAAEERMFGPKPKKGKRKTKSEAQEKNESDEACVFPFKEECSKEEETNGTDEFLTLANYQVTSMEQNGSFVLERKEADVACFEEHKIRASEVGRFKKQFKEAGWGMLCGPSDETKRNTSAGVGIMWNEKAKVV